MSEFAQIAQLYGPWIALLIAAGIWTAKNWEKFANRLAPVWAERRRVDQFEREQKAKADALTLEERQRNDATKILSDALKEYRDENKELKRIVLDIVEKQGRQNEQIVGALQNMTQIVTLQTERLSQQTSALTSLTGIIERIVGGSNV